MSKRLTLTQETIKDYIKSEKIALMKASTNVSHLKS